MTEPHEHPKRTSEVFAAAERARIDAELLRQQGINAPLAGDTGEPLEPPTPHVLDRRVMVKWASITLLIYIAMRLIMGPVKDAVVDAVREEIQNQANPVTNTAIPPVPTPPTKPVPPTTAAPAAPEATPAPEAPTVTTRERVRIQRR
ncbi:MAG TPA: hypothetical protein VIF83_14005 [Gemmatimonadaceae bacterium]|jgi:hypothetical protein